ncbi:alkaline phosphatase family protein [Halorubellus sp. JP-L1]|uniref:alkaline phosphatase family protein n=1 Tax=Halorubellus sp. JP-L1 TaxID=2715753 RepID=UPI0014098B86|nr:alkaline phosphatase family protein [Halorubellus sp. JP-L1]NHN40088.1 alkaline phosphatase family protein [Halorubellus sp. JP-L1]
MLRDEVAADLRDRFQEDGPRLYPAYEDYCFGNVPGTLTSALGEPTGTRRLPADVYDGVDGVAVDGARDVDYVLLFLVDGFGLAQWHDHRDHPVVTGIEASTTVTPLTSVFPSETAAAITTLNTGAYPAEHGVLGWDVYDPALDASFLGLKFDGTGGSDVSEYGAEDAFAVDAIYPGLDARGVDCRTVAPFPGSYSGATPSQYDGEDLATLPETVSTALGAADDPAYVYVYLPQIDASGHHDGNHSGTYADVVDETWQAVADAVAAADDALGADDDVLVAFAADHGQIDTDPERNVDLTTYPTVVDGLERFEDGSPVYLSGGPRSVELHVRDDAKTDVRRVLEEDVGAFVLDGKEAIDAGLYGDGPVAPETKRRVGDLVVLHPTLGVYFGGDAAPASLEFVGMHGGLHPDEMLVPFAAGRLDEVADALS